jgi:hypothetical protein
VLDKCSPPTLREAMDAARKSHGKDAESETAAAEQLWAAGAKVCGAWPPADSPLSRVMGKLMAR